MKFIQRNVFTKILTVCGYLSLGRFLDSAQSLLREAGSSLTQFVVCDNIDLPTILQVRVTSHGKCCTWRYSVYKSLGEEALKKWKYTSLFLIVQVPT